MTTTDYKCDMILPTELASILINNDWSILDYIDDEEYTKCVEQLVYDLLDVEGLRCVDVVDDKIISRFSALTELARIKSNIAIIFITNLLYSY